MQKSAMAKTNKCMANWLNPGKSEREIENQADKDGRGQSEGQPVGCGKAEDGRGHAPEKRAYGGAVGVSHR